MRAQIGRQAHGDEAGPVRAARVSHRPGMARPGCVRPGSGPAARQWELQWGPALDPWPRAAPAGWGQPWPRPPHSTAGEPRPKATSGRGAALSCTGPGPAARPPGGGTCSGPWHYFIWTSYTYTSTAPIRLLRDRDFLSPQAQLAPCLHILKNPEEKENSNFQKLLWDSKLITYSELGKHTDQATTLPSTLITERNKPSEIMENLPLKTRICLAINKRSSNTHIIFAPGNNSIHELIYRWGCIRQP